MTSRKRAVILSLVAAGAVVGVAGAVSRRRSRPWASRPAEPKGRIGTMWTEVNGMRMFARVSEEPHPADALPVVLVHGYGVSSSYLVPIAERLAVEFPVWAPDLPGHGRSDKPERILRVPELADALRAWMDAVGIRRAAFLGNSFGCQILADFAARFPERVDRLIFISPTADRRSRTLREHLPPFLRTGAAERPSLPFLLLVDYLRARPRRMVGELRAMFEDPIEEKLPRITAPSLVLRGQRDHIVPQSWAEEVARLLRAGPPHVIPDAGHALNYSAADELMRVIRPFLQRSAAATSSA